MNNSFKPNRWGRLSYISVFLLAFLPRLGALDTFLDPDSWYYVEGSRQFLIGLLRGDYAQTFQSGIPAVTTLWTASLAILFKYLARPETAPDRLVDFVAAIPTNPSDVGYVFAMRFPTVLLVSLSVVAVYWVAARFFGQRAALLGACLLALDPFHMAHSRVLHQDMLATTAMTLSVLCVLGYWLHGERQRWLLTSGVLAGLAFLSKSSSALLVPFCAIAGLWTLVLRWQRGHEKGWLAVGRLLRDSALWAAAAGLIYFACWPAMWVEPLRVLQRVLGLSARFASEGRSMGHYFLGQIVQDPGLLFYPLIWLLRMTPLTLLGLAGLLILRSQRNRPGSATDDRQSTTIYLLATYTLFNVAIMTWIVTKQERYILPVIPALDLLAGLGLIKLWQAANRLFLTPSQALGSLVRGRLDLGYLAMVALVAIGQGVLALTHYPYYFTYYNPLLGGARQAARLVHVGWGEGLDLAAAYLNQKPNPEHIKVTAWYHQAFAPYFRGQTTFFFSIGQAMSSDYLVFYQNQLQRQLPDADLLAYYQRHYTPEYVARLKGVDYALVYAVPLDHRTSWQLTNLPGKLILYGYRQAGAQPNRLTLRLVWETQAMSTQDGLWAALQGCQSGKRPACSQAIAWQSCALAPDFSPAEVQQAGTLVESVCELNTGDLEAGIYSLHVGLGPSPESAKQPIVDLMAPHGELGVFIPDNRAPRLIAPREAFDALVTQVLPPGALPLHLLYGDSVALIGYQVAPPPPQADQATTVTLYWQALQDIAQPGDMARQFQVGFDLVTSNGSVITQAATDPLNLAQTGDLWQTSQVLADSHTIRLPDDLSPGDYRLAVSLVNAGSGQPVPALDEVSGELVGHDIQLETAIHVP